MSSETWNFSEYENYVCYNITYHEKNKADRFVYIKDTRNKNRHAHIMAFLDVFTTHFQKHVSTSKKYAQNKCLNLFANTDHTFYELDKNPHFRGVNKPKNVHHCRNAKHKIGLDGLLRAHNRYVMIVIPQTAQELYDLYCHEITHTLCNHVRFRTDDHHGDKKEDFPQCERVVKNITSELNLLFQLEKVWKMN